MFNYLQNLHKRQNKSASTQLKSDFQLWEEDGLSTSGIADKLKQLGATLTGVVDRMEERNLVYRERDKSDRRIVST